MLDAGVGEDTQLLHLCTRWMDIHHPQCTLVITAVNELCQSLLAALRDSLYHLTKDFKGLSVCLSVDCAQNSISSASGPHVVLVGMAKAGGWVGDQHCLLFFPLQVFFFFFFFLGQVYVKGFSGTS